jgi:hypothetical protein
MIPLFFHDVGCTVVILVYVDDIIVTGNSSSLIQFVLTHLQSKFAVKDLGPL